MLEAEAIRLCEILLSRGDISPLLNLGSSTGEFRRVARPHIHERLFLPLEKAGIAVSHCDLKEGEGIDLSGDISDPALVERLKGAGFRCVLLSNLLEHVQDREKVASSCEEIVGTGGLILATVPSSYPYHADPIDTYYRPSPRELGALFRRSRALLEMEEVRGPSFRDQLRAQGTNVWIEMLRTLMWASIAPARPRGFAARLHRWFWYRRPYRISVVLVEVL